MIPDREEPTPFTATGRLNTLAAVEDYFGMVRAMFPTVFSSVGKFYFYQYDDPCKTLEGLFDAATGERLDRDFEWSLQWTFEDYCHNAVGMKGWRLVPDKNLASFLRGYWGLTNFIHSHGLAQLSLDAMGYYGMVMGSALHALSASKTAKGGRLIEDWQAKA